MAIPIGIQLYSVRDQLSKDYAGTIRAIAKMGYKYVEPAGFPGTTVAEAAKLFKDLGLQAPMMHCGLPVGDGWQETVETAKLLGVRYVVSGAGPGDFASLEKIRAMSDLWNQAHQNIAPHGLTLGYHNHWWEMDDLQGLPAYKAFYDSLWPQVVAEIDTYWAMVGKREPAAVITDLGQRVKLLHIKDGPGVTGKPMTAVGAGTMNFAPVFEAAKHAEYAIVELDECATDMMEAVKQSYDFLKSSGLGK